MGCEIGVWGKGYGGINDDGQPRQALISTMGLPSCLHNPHHRTPPHPAVQFSKSSDCLLGYVTISINIRRKVCKLSIKMMEIHGTYDFHRFTRQRSILWFRCKLFSFSVTQSMLNSTSLTQLKHPCSAQLSLLNSTILTQLNQPYSAQTSLLNSTILAQLNYPCSAQPSLLNSTIPAQISELTPR